MAEVERIWRITGDAGTAIELRLFVGPHGDQQVVIDQPGSEGMGTVFDVEVARAVAQAMLEACEVASALGEQFAAVR